ncbi:unnamed protein product [Chilo suppressalis]|uniref:RBR-type E3 ubiquitin transferase n=1 Tax=Chilo suppressalis TaxID=168631 RepID=A0ABN8BD27_CHISP|nr:unnamed protein product [Chilo suppressalis]
MLKGRSRDARAVNTTPAHLARPLPQQPTSVARTLAAVPSSTRLTLRTPTAQRAPLAKPEPDYEVVEFPSEQYVNAKLQPPPPPPPRPPTGHPADAGASCGLCGGGGARVRCAECGRRALCASCDDMYHRHPKRRHHQRQALTMSQLRDERPPLPPKAVAPVPPPRRHKLSGASPSPRPPADPRSATLGPHSLTHAQNANTNNHNMMAVNNHMSTLPTQHAAMPPHLQGKILGSMPYLPNLHHAAPAHPQTNTLGPLASGWGRPRGSLPGFNIPPNMQMPSEAWDGAEHMTAHQSWGRPLRRGASVLELGGGAPGMIGGVAGCAGCATAWRYGSCASLDHPWGAWAPQSPCCAHAPPPPPPHHHAHAHTHTPYTPQPYRRADSRAASRAASRTCSRAASPAMSTRSRASRRVKHRTPSPPLPSSDADSESERDGEPRPPAQDRYSEKPQVEEPNEEDTLGPAPAPPTASWQCEHCTFVNEPGVRVCVVCCRTPTSAPKIIPTQAENINTAKQSRNDAQSITDSARSIADTARSIARLDVNERTPSPPHANGDSRVQNGAGRIKTASKKERVTTGCGPSPPREDRTKKTNNRLVTPTREASVSPSRHDMGVGSSPPREVENRMSLPNKQDVSVRASPYREIVRPEAVTRHSVSIGPSPPREIVRRSPSVQKKSAGTSSSEIHADRRPAVSTRANVSNTGTSPPPQSISTQTYEVPNSWERAPSRSRARQRFRDDARRERSHSRHSLSSDTRESERSARTSGGGGGGGGGTSGRWEWREGRDSSPVGEWSDGERRRARPTRLARRASHLDLRRTRAPHADRRASYYGSEAASPEPTRAMSLEALAGAGAVGTAAAERGLELARLMGEAERLGFSAAEVQAALAQSPGAPLHWLRERWPTLCAGVRAAAARLEPRALVSELEARAALARHRGAMWPAVTDCVERHRRQAAAPAVSAMSGRVWGSPAGAEDDAAPPRRAEGSSDEFEGPAPAELRDDDWMYLPLDANPKARVSDPIFDPWERPLDDRFYGGAREAALAVDLLVQAAAPPPRDDLLFQTLLPHDRPRTEAKFGDFKLHSLDLYQSENDFIDAYNALTRSTPLPVHEQERATESGLKRDTYDVFGNDSDYINSANDVIADGPSNSFKNVTNDHNHQSNTETQQKKRFEVISTTVNTSASISIPENEIRNGLTNVSENRFKETSPLHDSQKVFDEGQVNESISSSTPTVIITNNVETLHNITDSKLRNISPPVIQKQSEMPSTENLDVTVSPVQTHIINTDERTPVVRKYENTPISLQDEEKSNNLNEIVDNTQRLIQQMKEEINFDINSIDSRNISQSEADSSSNESDISTEHESSYSESEEDSDNLSSNDESSITDSNEKQLSEKRPTIVQRTSSEENDNFEEAMDHIEDQIEDFKHTNIELLDSIARSLQEEHIVSVEVNQQKNVNDKSEDQNNNVYTEVNSFEEIYAELKTAHDTDSNHANEVNINADSTINANVNNDEYKTQDVPIPVKVPNINLPKFEIVMSFLPSTNFTNLLISSSNIPSTYNAELDFIEETAVINENIQNDILNEENISSETSSESDTETFHNSDRYSGSTVQKNALDNKSGESELKDDNHVEFNKFEDASPTQEASDMRDLTQNNENLTKAEVATTGVSPLSSEETEEMRVVEEVIKEQNTDRIDVAEEKIDDPLTEAQSNRKSSSEQIPEPTVSKSSSNNSIASKTLNSIKSNIPKLIKIVQSNKQKPNKTSPKVIASKVPVRRPSQKQYPAPVPPKSHFGNIQSGHVKQLQTRLFNNELPKTSVNIPSTVEVKPSTSTLHKKKPAPLPPTKETKQPSPVNTSPPKQKKDNFFRESCRTEDEWTESDSEESQIQVVKATAEPVRAPSPPPPLTLRRVSGQIIDLAKVQLPEGSPERQARMVLAQGAAETWEQAQLAVELAARGATAPSALLAALDCADLAAALAYLHQDCELCASRLPEHEMVSMLRCTHRCCRECARHYFTVQITERSIADCVCPYCKVPDLENIPEDSWLEYFAHLDILLKTLLETEVHELFQRKLRDRTLARDPNFRWCMECSSGFFVHPKQKRVRCPECRSVSCAKCRKAWSANHEGLSCEQYAAWLEDNDPERSVAAVQQHLRENGLECPRCHFKYSLSRGGCMHFTCTQCKYEFCYGCGKPFTMGARCGLSDYCAKLGLHAHHPRNCLFYLRDKEPHQLQTLLQMNNVAYETEAPEGSSTRCPIQLQRETPTGLVDGTCGGDVPPNHAGLCKPHYVEYLAAQARQLDPIPIMDVSELVAELRRRALPLPERGPWDSDPIYAGMCAEIVKEKIPLD